MKTIRKLAILMVLLTSLTVYSFGETLYTATFGFHQVYEIYPKDDYGRDLTGSSFIFTLFHYPENFPLGWFLKTTFGMTNSGYEWQGEIGESVNIYSTADIQISVGPSKKFQIGSSTFIPLSLGLVFSHYGEDGGSRWYNDSGSDFIRAFNMGVIGDFAILIIPNKRFTIVNGLNVSWDFLRWEKGHNGGSLRPVNSGRFELADYNAFKFNLYTGIGLRFGSPATQNKPVIPVSID